MVYKQKKYSISFKATFRLPHFFITEQNVVLNWCSRSFWPVGSSSCKMRYQLAHYTIIPSLVEYTNMYMRKNVTQKSGKKSYLHFICFVIWCSIAFLVCNERGSKCVLFCRKYRKKKAVRRRRCLWREYSILYLWELVLGRSKMLTCRIANIFPFVKGC